ncbi:ImmA/IrrE family metallo-endopeptidase [Streptococcus dysgalactiae]|uniref:ImmA/IrrE family metallo-endopeptidase n=1 Tax=Streptococcus dysgalactiae TaxID=1334 RepID=UPI00028BC4B2|nr:ImmA/IrrE family metallo-endopeptidase [Streptococcus dysgalactiae]QQY18185.1 ImmA/IrrE family metallo-endopeptidase [Streptococcus dysgalactiae]TYK96330.1 ImmA/IrrE family metallo-endopeptidase [Streptococcus dysgalactiae]TYL01544.1 ImmA/IrrE family metallo-endopeptidase [Streptococcus dysgalactiae]WEQ79694.1 ImmA/IrrE family metallo-endopeptidase [Streptococcus dysgalactiae subsp. equisimilis]WJD52511.1 ImmA/IrrE family metallo-endopeptidase [Streptococcus dysgalactiae subsp. equisimilis]
MDELYSRVSVITKQVLYSFMKEEETSTLHYHFHYYFDYCVHENNIQVISHHFSNHKIEGLTVIDELGTSFSYEQDNPVTKRHFTLCHELGHFILEHDGSYFTESVDNQESILEREANVFSAIVLMPDIVLLSKIYYSCDSFHKVKEDLEVSKQALYFRLIDLLRVYQVDTESVIKQAVDEYLDGQNASLHHYFHQLKEILIEEFNQYQPSLIARLKKRLKQSNFVTSQELSELLDQKRWDEIRAVKNFKVWLVYNKGKSLAYVWDSNKLSEAEARRKANLELLVM